MKNIVKLIGEDLLEILPAFVFFLVMFHIVIVTRALMLEEYGVTTRSSTIALIGALIVAKVIFLADKFPFLNLYPRRPLFWNVLLKTFVFGFFTFIFQWIEEILRQAHKYGGFSAAYEHLVKDVAWRPVFWSSEIWVMVLLLFYCSAVELVRAIGVTRAKEIFFNGQEK